MSDLPDAAAAIAQAAVSSSTAFTASSLPRLLVNPKARSHDWWQHWPMGTCAGPSWDPHEPFKVATGNPCPRCGTVMVDDEEGADR